MANPFCGDTGLRVVLHALPEELLEQGTQRLTSRKGLPARALVFNSSQLMHVLLQDPAQIHLRPQCSPQYGFTR